MLLQPIKSGYGQFKFFQENRDLNQANIENISEAIENTYLLDLYPIVTNKEKVIGDGQHRFTVARDLLLPFYAIESDDVSVEDIARANSNTRPYTLDDAKIVYAKLGLKAYQYISDFGERNPVRHKRARIQQSSTRNAMKWLDPLCNQSSFINGDFVVRKPESAQVIYDLVKDYCAVQDFVEMSKYIEVIANLAMNPLYDHKRMMGRLARVPTRLKRVATAGEGFDLLTSIYNYSMREENHVKLAWLDRTKQIDRYDQDAAIIDDGGITALRGVVCRPVEIKESSDYARFSFHPCRRSIDNRHFRALKESMKSKNLSHCYPIICDSSMTIIDGQCRYLAAKELGLPIHYIQSTNVTLPMIVRASACSRSWRAPDYLKYYCSIGEPVYLKLNNFVTKYPFVRLQNATRMMHAVGHINDVAHYFKSGQLRETGLEYAVKMGEALLRIRDNKLRAKSAFQLVLYRSIRFLPDFDIELFIRQVNLYLDLMDFTDRASCEACVEHVYNMRSRGDRFSFSAIKKVDVAA